jgi:D-alanyl-D-alanine carboxypeptidase (penicillin-binding protein 5/6)
MLALLWALAFIHPAAAALPEVKAKSYVLMDADSGRILQAQNEHEQLPPASMTKLMTIILALEALDNGKARLTDQVTASDLAAGMGGSQIYLRAGEVMSYEDLLISIMVGSANDSCVAVAEYLEGSHEGFVEAMNRKAEELNLKDTHFVNANGLPAENHYSSAYDMAQMGYYALKHLDIRKYSSLKEYDLRQGEFKLYNTNKLLWWYEGADGLKTGWTTEAQYCLTATAKREGLRLISAVMASPETNGQFADSMQILNAGFARYGYMSFFVRHNVCAAAPIGKGEVDQVDLAAAEDIGVIYEKDQENAITYTIRLNENISAPVEQGQILGQAVVYNQGSAVKEVDLLAAAPVERGGVIRQILKALGETLMI